MIAVKERKKDIVKMLIDAGADKNIQSESRYDQDTALKMARKLGFYEIVELLE